MPTPQEFKQRILQKFPQGMTSDGVKYSDLDALELTNRMVNKFPEGKTSDGINYSDFLQQPKQKSLLPKEEKKQGFLRGITKPFADLNIGALKGLGRSILGASQLGAEALSRVPLIGGGEEARRGPIALAEKAKQSKFLTPSNTAQKIGAGAEQVAEFLAPGTSAFKAGSVVKAGLGGGKVASGLGLLTTSLGEGLLGAGQTAIQQGKIDEEAKLSGKIGALTPPAFKLGGKILKGAGKVGSEILGKTTGAGKQPIVEAFNNPEVMKLAKKANIDMPRFQSDVLDTLKEGVSDIAQKASRAYSTRLAKFKLSPKQYDNIVSDLRETAKENFNKFDLSIAPQEKAKKLNEIDFSKSTIINGQPVVERAWNNLMSWTDETAGGLDTLKKRLFKFRDELPKDAKSANAFLSGIANRLDKSLKNNVKGYEAMTSKYRQAQELLDEINDAFKPGGSKETAIKKAISSLRENNETRKELLDLIGGRELINKVAATQLASAVPKGLSGSLIGLGGATGGAIGILNPNIWPLLISAAASTSPRLVGELASVLGKIRRPMIASGNLPLVIARELREIMLKLYNE